MKVFNDLSHTKFNEPKSFGNEEPHGEPYTPFLDLTDIDGDWTKDA